MAASPMKHIALLGATGLTGTQLLQQALSRGHKVKAIVRNPSKITITDDSLQVVTGNIFDVESLKQCFEGCDTVISCLGGGLTERTFYVDYATPTVAAMRGLNIKRLIVMTSWATKKHPGNGFFTDVIMRSIIGTVMDSCADMEDYLMSQCTDIDFTVVRPPGLSNGSITDQLVLAEENVYIIDRGWCSSLSRMSRADVARFILDTLEGDNFNHVCVAIAI